MTNETAHVVEVFSSSQGEGPFVGVRQVFLRFFGCNIRCIYCDTPDSLTKPKDCLIETGAGSRTFEAVPNPIAPDALADMIERFSPRTHHSVSLTGGEPLMHASFLREFLPILKARGHSTYLETNGILSKQLESVLDWIDIISMDIKLPATIEPQYDLFDEHEEFLRLSKRKQAFVKLVVMSDTPDSEVVRAARLVESVGPSIPLVLQPVTPDGKASEAPSPARMLHLHSLVGDVHRDVRLIPQVHKLIGQM